jgi:tryptophan synthase alpha chain
MLITPATSEERILLIDAHTEGFIYMVSAASTTGAKNTFDTPTLDYFRRINAMQLKNPRLIGFGISNRETLQAAFDNASGAIIGSKFISLLGQVGVKGAVEELIKIKKA